MENKELQLRGFRKVTDTEDGGIRDIRATWPGVLAMLLRKIIKDMYVGKSKEGNQQQVDESYTYTQIEEIIEHTIKLYNPDIDRTLLNNEKNRLLVEFARDAISIKFLGEFLHILDLNWVDISITMQRKSGTIKTYTQHIGGIGTVQHTGEEIDQEYIDKTGVHEDPIHVEENNIVSVHSSRKKKGKEKKT